jgi:hypothetical protein
MTGQRGNGLLTSLILIAMVVIASASAVGYFYWQNQLLSKSESGQSQNQAQPTTIPASQPTVPRKDRPANWKTYSNQKWSVFFSYPATHTRLSEQDWAGGQSNPYHYPNPVLQVGFSDVVTPGNGFQFRATADSPNYDNFFNAHVADAPLESINGQQWRVDECTIANTGAIAPCLYSVGYYLQKNNMIYSFVFKGGQEQAPSQQQILSTFRLTP